MGGLNLGFPASFFEHFEDRLNLAVYDTNEEYRMGIADIRSAFMDEVGAGWRLTDCELHTVPDGKNSQQLIINGVDNKGESFALDSGPFNPMQSPVDKAREMARGQLNSAANPTQPAEAPVSSASLLPPVQAIPTTQGATMSNPGGFAASLKAMLDQAKAGVVQAQTDGLAKVQAAVGKLNDAAAHTTAVSDNMAKSIEDQANSVLAELGQISNLPPPETTS